MTTRSSLIYFSGDDDLGRLRFIFARLYIASRLRRYHGHAHASWARLRAIFELHLAHDDYERARSRISQGHVLSLISSIYKFPSETSPMLLNYIY